MGYLHYAINGLKPRNFFNIARKTFADAVGINKTFFSNDVHMKSAIEWLSYAQKQNNDGGVSALYSLFDGWHPSYVETTGYIIPSFFNYAQVAGEKKYSDCAIQMAEFELNSQLQSGAFPGGGKKDTPIVFNTGQVIFGLCRAFQETKDERYKDSLERASQWLVSVMDPDGCWRRFEYLGHAHTYNTRTAWALLCANSITGGNSYKQAAQRNIDWALTQQQENGWFENNAFYPKQEPLVHTIAYSIRGILESAIYLKKKKYLESALKAANPLVNLQRKDGSLAGSFNSEWKSSVDWSCLTGNSQMSIIWQKLHIATGDDRFLEAAKKSNIYMKRMQNLSSSNPSIKGGIPGAYPIYGWYAPFCYINWAAKFFVDSLMLESNPKIHPRIV